MEITRNTRVMNIVSDPDLRQVLEWYGLPTGDRGLLRLSLQDFCMHHDVDVEDVLVELTMDEVDRRDDDEDDWDEDEDEDWLAAR